MHKFRSNRVYEWSVSSTSHPWGRREASAGICSRIGEYSPRNSSAGLANAAIDRWTARGSLGALLNRNLLAPSRRDIKASPPNFNKMQLFEMPAVFQAAPGALDTEIAQTRQEGSRASHGRKLAVTFPRNRGFCPGRHFRAGRSRDKLPAWQGTAWNPGLRPGHPYHRRSRRENRRAGVLNGEVKARTCLRLTSRAWRHEAEPK